MRLDSNMISLATMKCHFFVKKDPTFYIELNLTWKHWWFNPSRKANDSVLFVKHPLVVKARGRQKWSSKTKR